MKLTLYCLFIAESQKKSKYISNYIDLLNVVFKAQNVSLPPFLTLLGHIHTIPVPSFQADNTNFIAEIFYSFRLIIIIQT